MASITIPLRSQKSNAILKKSLNTSQTFLGDLQFLQKLGDEGRLVIAQNSINALSK